MNLVNSKKQLLQLKRIIFLFAIISFFIVPVYVHNTKIVSAGNNEWDIKINLSCEDGLYDYVVFGENSQASDGLPHDDYDKPKPPPTIPPYVRLWFSDGLSEPYNVLLEDYRKSQDTNKIWNLSVMWVSSDNNSSELTFSWNIENKTNIEYGSIRLYEKGKNSPLADFLNEDSYSMSFNYNELREFQIICENSTVIIETEESDNTLLIIIVIIAIAIAASFIVFRRIKG